jgi:sigma-E factor negative regulatory protein RseC
MLQHRGVVERIEDNKVFVRVEKESACQACHAKGLCGESGSVRIVEVRTERAASYQAGERVVVALLKGGMAVSSVVWGYVLPLVVLLVTLLTSHVAGVADGVAALITIGAVALYYVVLYMMRHHFDKRIQFTIIKE